MDKKKLLLIGGAVLALIIIVITIIALLPKEKQASPSESLVSIVLAKGQNTAKQPVAPTDVFLESDKEIFAFVTFNNLSAGSVIEYQWYDTQNKKILKTESRKTSATFSGTSISNLIKNEDERLTWELGNFEFKVLILGQEIGSKKYRFITRGDDQKNKILSSITNIDLTTAVDVYGKPAKNITNIFSREDPDIYASITYQNMPQKVAFEARWIYVKDNNRLIDKYQKNIEGSGTFAFGINAKEKSWVPIKKWLAGKYVLQVYLDGELFREVDFVVE